jgi:molecular chaperone DnaK
MKRTIGIDLGTSNSCVSIIEGGDPIIIPNSEGKRTTPSIVAFLKDGERKIGDPAKRQAITNPKNTVYSIKRFIGFMFKELSKEHKNVAYKIVEDNNMIKVDVDGKLYTPQEISAMVLQKMKKTAEDYLGTEVSDAVITVPAWFNDSQRQATKDAGEIAGLNVLRVLNEPTAAALSYGINKKNKDMKVAVFDFGGGTADISILDLSEGLFEVLATNGDTLLGGDDIDNLIVNWVADDFYKEFNVDLRKDPMALQRLMDAAEKAKIELSSSTSTEINLPYIIPIDGVPKHLVKTLNRSTFDQMIDDIINKLLKLCEKSLKDAKLKSSDIDEILLVGGSTRIPIIQNKVEQFFGKAPSKGVNPDEVVALGAAIQGAIIQGDIDDILLLDVTPLSLGIETMGGVMTKIINANTTIPSKKSEVFTTAVDNQPSVEIHVLQGERSLVKDNKSIGRFHLDGIPPAMRNTPKIEVTFDIDANGILQVSAKDQGTGKEQSIRIEASSGLSQEDIDRMKKDAEENSENDRIAKEKIDKLNMADSLTFQFEKNLKDFSDKISEDDKKNIENLIEKLKTARKDENVNEIDKIIEEINQLFHKMSENVYANTNTTQPDIDADTQYEEVK